MEENQARWQLLREFDEKGIATTGRRECDLEKAMVNNFLSTLPLPDLLATFFTSTTEYSSEEWKLCSRVFSRLIPFIQTNFTSDPAMETWILAGLNHTEECMVKIALECISHCPASHEWSSAMYHKIVKLVAHPSSAHEKASDLILSVLY